jgi:hypothetical protein
MHNPRGGGDSREDRGGRGTAGRKKLPESLY